MTALFTSPSHLYTIHFFYYCATYAFVCVDFLGTFCPGVDPNTEQDPENIQAVREYYMYSNTKMYSPAPQSTISPGPCVFTFSIESIALTANTTIL